MELTVKLENNADVNFIKKVLLQLNGVITVESNDENKDYSWDEVEKSTDFNKVMEQSDRDYKDGASEELTNDLLKEICRKK